MKLKIAIVVHGRFHAFDLTRALLGRGHDVALFTNYPKWAVKRFGISDERVYSFWAEGVASRTASWVSDKTGRRYPDRIFHPLFGRWAARHLTRERWDVVLCWSGVAEEVFSALKGTRTLRICHRSSSHIRYQARILEAERERTQRRIEIPGSWIVAREEREYALADRIHVPSSFVKETFLIEAGEADKVDLITHGVDTKAFRASVNAVESRCHRILSGQPLQVLNVGTFSFRKGMWDLATVVKELRRENFAFHFVGPVAPEASGVASQLSDQATFVPKRPQHELPKYYERGDIFVLPTVEDGFPFVLAQAFAAGLPILTTPNGAGTDLVREGETGWVLPIRSPKAFIDRLEWCDSHRQELAKIVHRIHSEFQPRDWSDVAVDFEKLINTSATNHREVDFDA